MHASVANSPIPCYIRRLCVAYSPMLYAATMPRTICHKYAYAVICRHSGRFILPYDIVRGIVAAYDMTRHMRVICLPTPLCGIFSHVIHMTPLWHILACYDASVAYSAIVNTSLSLSLSLCNMPPATMPRTICHKYAYAVIWHITLSLIYGILYYMTYMPYCIILYLMLYGIYGTYVIYLSLSHMAYYIIWHIWHIIL